MSRIGRMPIEIPKGVTVDVTPDNAVTDKGPKGELVKKMHQDIDIKVEDESIVFTKKTEKKDAKALHGLTRSLVNNMVVGVTEGYKNTLELVGVGYRAQLQGKKLVLSLGYSHPVEFDAIEGVEFTVESPTKLIITGIDKEKVGDISADIRAWRKPEPYKGKGIKFEGEIIRRKVGKTGK